MYILSHFGLFLLYNSNPDADGRLLWSVQSMYVRHVAVILPRIKYAADPDIQ